MDTVRAILAAPTVANAGRGPMRGQMIEKPVRIVRATARAMTGLRRPQRANSNQIPAIAIEILEHGDLAVRRVDRLPNELYALGQHRLMVAIEIVRLEEQDRLARPTLPMKASCSGDEAGPQESRAAPAGERRAGRPGPIVLSCSGWYSSAPG